ncbi:MAG TPA: serine--tRNA ligase [Ktedonobacteraceae bacterium]|jgi:seryl-tRNA synthetase
MLSLDFICQHPDVVYDALRKRGDIRNIDEILRLAEQRRGLVTRSDGLYPSLKQLKETVRSVPIDKRSTLNAQIKAITEDIQRLELQSADVDTRLQLLLLSLPNLPHPSVKEGDEATVGEEVRRWREPTPFSFELRPHWELGTLLGIIDAEAGIKIAGSRFLALKGAGARLERALISFMVDVHTHEHGYTEVMLPHLVKRSVMIGAGQLSNFETQVYACTEDELYLNPTAEIPLVGMHSDSIVPADMLPLRYVAWTTAFRREADPASRQNRGLLRLHQFNTVELFQFVTPQDSPQAFEQILQHAETILQQLELSYRVVALNTTHLPFSAAKSFDIEVWMPEQNDFIAVSSVNNCETFQAQRANIKYRPTGIGQAMYLHTINGSGLTVGRTMAAVLEAYQQADGSVVIPKVLRPYMGTSQISLP